jgi:hypothetical protein
MTQRITCHAPHPDPSKRGQACGTPLGAMDEAVQFVTTSDRDPQVEPGQIWVKCGRQTCGRWNRFTRLSKEAAS